MTLGFVPAKTRSRRVPGKNFTLNDAGVTFITAAVNWLLQFEWVDVVLVSTDNLTLLQERDPCEWASDARVVLSERSEQWANPDMPLVSLYRMALEMFPHATYVIATQPDNPVKVPPDTVEDLYREFIQSDRDELFSVDTTGRKTGALHLMTDDAIRESKLAHYCRVCIQEIAHDIDTPEDMKRYTTLRDHSGSV